MSQFSSEDIKALADCYIKELRILTYGSLHWTNEAEGDYGSWKSWEEALVEFGERIWKLSGVKKQEPTKPQWIKNTEKMPDYKIALLKWSTSGGGISCRLSFEPDEDDWKIKSCGINVLEYMIIE